MTAQSVSSPVVDCKLMLFLQIMSTANLFEGSSKINKILLRESEVSPYIALVMGLMSEIDCVSQCHASQLHFESSCCTR
jgi:hypothetical protein